MLLIAIISCAPLSGGSTAPQPSHGVIVSYDVRMDAQAELTIDASFERAPTAELIVERGAAPFVEELGVVAGDATRSGASWRVRCGSPCRIHYRFRLADAARALHDESIALASGAAFFAPPATWLLHPAAAGSGGRVRFRVQTEPGQLFATAIHATDSQSFECELAALEDAGAAGFGAIEVHRVDAAGATLVIAPGIAIAPAALVAWTRREIAAVDSYFGQPRDGRVLVLLLPGEAQGTRGVTLGGGGASASLRLGKNVTERQLDDDWVLAHELIHTRFPSLPRRHSWFSEGLASFVEPIGRVRVGLLTQQKLWRDLLDGLPQGLAGPDDRGLDSDHTWGRIYWGGQLYLLLADLEIREQTHGARSLEDALRAITDTGANVERAWSMERVLEVADGATGTRVMHELYARMALAAGSEDLEGLWTRLGVIRDGESVRFDERAPLAAARRALTALEP